MPVYQVLRALLRSVYTGDFCWLTECEVAPPSLLPRPGGPNMANTSNMKEAPSKLCWTYKYARTFTSKYIQRIHRLILGPWGTESLNKMGSVSSSFFFRIIFLWQFSKWWHFTVLWSVTQKIGALTKLGLFFPVVCFISVFDQNLAEQLHCDKGLLKSPVAWILYELRPTQVYLSSCTL